MFDIAPLHLNRSGLQLFLKRKGDIKTLGLVLDSRNLEKHKAKKQVFNEQIDAHLQNRAKHNLKRADFEDKRKKRIQFLYTRERCPKQPADGFLYINSEKKEIIGRTPESDKKVSPKRSIPICSPCKTFYTAKIPPVSVPIFSTPQSAKIIPKVFRSPYDIWKMNNNILPETKVFIIVGTYPDVRKSLLQRGWHENMDIDSSYFDLKWARNARTPQSLQDWQLFNHFPRNLELSLKWNLYENIKKTQRSTQSKYLGYFPRSFRLDSKGYEDFFEYYKAIYAVSLLKSYKESPSAHTLEKISVATIISRRYLNELERQKLTSPRTSALVLNIEWKILTSEDLSEIKSAYTRLMLPPVSDLYSSVTSLLSELSSKDPQFLINGKKNIWIVKAGRKSRGRDIALFTELSQIDSYTSTPNNWVIQKYIENPLIISHKKFDIRQWVLVSNSDPLTIWIYKSAYLRFSIEDYDDENLMNLYIHLTNNSISKKSKKFGKSDIEGCMWSIEKFQEYLIEEKGRNLWTESIYPAIKKIVKSSLVSVGNLGRNNSFELFGYDFMIDEELRPWLLEINSSPAMDYSTSVTEVLVKEVLEDVVKVVVDFTEGQNTGGFQLCYRSKNYIPVRSNS